MRYLSICSGIEAASLAWRPLGWQVLALSEVDAFARAVLRHHYPDVPLYGDFTQLRDHDWIVDADVLVGGPPCQSFSIAGLRGSLSDDRGNLTLEFVRLADAIDDLRRAAGRPPCWILYENVPGIFSTADNAFGSLMGGLCGSDAAIDPSDGGRWTDAGVVAGPDRIAAWRCLDAQHFGLAQRRKRVFVLARGHPGAWACADALLPLTESLHWHPAPRREAGQRAARPSASGTPGGSGYRNDADNLIAYGISSDAFDRSGEGANGTPGERAGLGIVADASPALRAKRPNAVAYGGNNTAGPIDVATARNAHGGPHGRLDFETETFVLPALTGTSEGRTYTHEESNNFRLHNVVPVMASGCAGANSAGIGQAEDPMFALDTRGLHGVAFDLRGREGGSMPEGPHDTANIWASSGGSSRSYVAGSGVRRLTPEECERLQGVPVNYTRIPWRGRPAEECPDGPRYKTLGNSFAVPVVAWIGRRIVEVAQ